MLPSKERLKDKHKINLLLKKGKRLSSPFFTLFFLPKEKKTNNLQVTVSVSLKVSKSAVKRNQIRRRILAAIRELKSSYPDLGSLLFIVKRELLDVDFVTIKLNIDQCLKKLSYQR